MFILIDTAKLKVGKWNWFHVKTVVHIKIWTLFSTCKIGFLNSNIHQKINSNLSIITSWQWDHWITSIWKWNEPYTRSKTQLPEHMEEFSEISPKVETLISNWECKIQQKSTEPILCEFQRLSNGTEPSKTIRNLLDKLEVQYLLLALNNHRYHFSLLKVNFDQ